jgi:hypothetical protein
VCKSCYHSEGAIETETEIKKGRRVKLQKERNGVEERKVIKGKRTFEFSTKVNKKLQSLGCDAYSGKWGSGFTVNCSILLQIILKMEAVCSSSKLVPVYAA